MTRYQKEEPKKKGCFMGAAVSVLIIIGLANLLWPRTIPFAFLQFWRVDDNFWNVFREYWGIFLWGGGVTAIASLATRHRQEDNRRAEEHLVAGVLVSLRAGLLEEICFRWLIFFGAIVSLKILNWLFFGWAGFGIAEWVYTGFLIPVADFCTLRILHDVLYSSAGWAVGAALISSNAKFRNGHEYLGWLGWVNSWFLGMIFFKIVFTYGLPAAILLHFLYDLLIFFVRYLGMVVERARGWA